MKQFFSFLLVLIFAVILGSQPSGRETVGKQADGTVMLPNGWRIAPVGEQVPLDTLPMSTAISSVFISQTPHGSEHERPAVALSRHAIGRSNNKRVSSVAQRLGWRCDG